MNELDKLVKKRLKQNKKIFNEKELKIINESNILIRKIYLLGVIDSFYKSLY